MPRFTPWLVVLTLAAAGAAAAAGYGLTAPKRYRATAQLLVLPVSRSDAAFAGLDLLRDSSGRRTAAATAAVLLRSPEVADAVRTQLGLHQTAPSLLAHLQTGVVGPSDVVDVTVEAGSAVGAAQVANTFVDTFIAQRTATFQSELAAAVRRDAQLLTAGGRGATALAARIALLRSFQGAPDPTLRRGDTAMPPPSASWPDVPRLVGIGAGIGLGAGLLLLLGLAAWRRRGQAPLPQYDPAVADTADRPALDAPAAEALVARLEQRLAAREAALAARERDLQARIDELRALEPAPAPADLAAREAALADRERLLEERVAQVTQRELELARRAGAAARPEPPAAVPAPLPPAADGEEGVYNLVELQQLVDERAESYPERADEWRSYLFFLRDYAAPDGSLPAQFDWLILDTFRELVA